YTPIAGDISHPVYEKGPDFVLPEIKTVEKPKTLAKQKPKASIKLYDQFAVNNSKQKEPAIIEEITPIEIDSKTVIAALDEEKPVIEKEVIEVLEQMEKPEFRTVKITYIASAGSASEMIESTQKADSTSRLKKFIAFAEKIDPGDVLADIKTAKDNLINGGLKSKKERNSL
ncbi:MAG: hypothetical protein HRT61_06425, partial [Ekhidna sp.]|nr:hypothetical protein [Ekhidna sp.]